MDLPTGEVVLEETADERRSATGHALGDQRLTALKAQGRYLVRDRAKALSQLAEKGWACLSMPACFPLVHDSVKRYALALGRRLPQARQELATAAEGLQKHHQGNPQGAAYREAPSQVEAQQGEGPRGEARLHE
jgi:hypothetical protein